MHDKVWLKLTVMKGWIIENKVQLSCFNRSETYIDSFRIDLWTIDWISLQFSLSLEFIHQRSISHEDIETLLVWIQLIL